MTPNWEWQQQTEGESVLLVRGDLDVAIGAEFVRAVNEALAADGAPTQVVIDLGAIEFIDSSGLRGLLQLQQTHGERIRVGTMSDVVKRLLELTGTLDHFLPGDGERHE